MPIDRKAWRTQLNLSNFVNTYYQYRDLRRCGDVKTILIVGPGQGLDTAVLRWVGHQVTTLDIDDAFEPDVVASVHDLSMFSAAQFDVVIASHVLEHMAEPYLDPALRELARVGRFVLVYLPAHGRHLQVRVKPGFRDLDLSLTVDLFNYFRRPNGVDPHYCAGQHFWEVGMRGYRVRDLSRRFSVVFDVLDSYRNRDWNMSYNFVLRSREHASP
jgi:hypothetical protein